MVFEAFDRGVLEQLFENSISHMKTTVDLTRDQIFRNVLNDKDGVDLALGLELGVIHTSFMTGFKQRHNRSLNSDEKSELLKITQSKLGQLKEAIFKCG